MAIMFSFSCLFRMFRKKRPRGIALWSKAAKVSSIIFRGLDLNPNVKRGSLLTIHRGETTTLFPGHQFRPGTILSKQRPDYRSA